MGAIEQQVGALLGKAGNNADEALGNGVGAAASRVAASLDGLDGKADGKVFAVLPPANLKATAELGLAGLAVALQLGALPGVGALPWVGGPVVGALRMALAPLLGFEAYLKTLALTAAAAKSGMLS